MAGDHPDVHTLMGAGKRARGMVVGTHDGRRRWHPDEHRHVTEIQRSRILSAMFEVCSELGAVDVAVADVIARAGVSRRTFYELFDSCEQCLLAACDDALARASRYVLDSYDPNAPWAGRIRSALTGLLSFLEVEPGAGRLLLVGSLGAGASALERRRRVLAQVIAAVEEGRTEGKTGDGPSSLTAEGIVGGVLFVLARRMEEAEQPALVELTGPLMSTIVLPYLGPAAARKEFARPVPESARVRTRTPARNPLTQLDIRLTYRTMRVLLAVGALGGRGLYPSNRQVGRAAGIDDQGQISKLLKRLARLGLIELAGESAKGAPNAWTLTPKGAAIHDAIASSPGLGAEAASSSADAAPSPPPHPQTLPTSPAPRG